MKTDSRNINTNDKTELFPSDFMAKFVMCQDH